MGKIVRRICLILMTAALLFLVSCIGDEHGYKQDIKKNAVGMMECVVSNDAEKLLSYFNEDMRQNYSEKTLQEIQQLFDYIDGNITSYHFKGQGSGMESKDEGKVYYYSCYPEFVFTTDSGKEYTIEFSYHYIWEEHPEYEGINMMSVMVGDDRNTELSIGRSLQF